MNIARGSLEELRYLLLLSCDIGYIEQSEMNAMERTAGEICLMLDALIKSIHKGMRDR